MQLTCTRRSIEQEQNASLIDKWKRFQDEIEPERLLRLGRTVIQKDSSKEQSNLQLQLYVWTCETGSERTFHSVLSIRLTYRTYDKTEAMLCSCYVLVKLCKRYTSCIRAVSFLLRIGGKNKCRTFLSSTKSYATTPVKRKYNWRLIWIIFSTAIMPVTGAIFWTRILMRELSAL